MPKVFRNEEVDDTVIETESLPSPNTPSRQFALQTGHNLYRVSKLDNLQKAVNALSNAGGGQMYLTKGDYRLKATLLVPSNITIIGEDKYDVNIILDNGSSIKLAGTEHNETGSVSSIASNVTVTGTGTSWLTTASNEHRIFIDGRWYAIASVTNDTTIVLAEPYIGDSSFDYYAVAKTVNNVGFRELTVRDSSGDGFDLDDCYDVSFTDVITRDQGVFGAQFDYVSNIDFERVIVQDNGSNGLDFEIVGTLNFIDVEFNGNTTDGMAVDGLDDATFTNCRASSNGGRGLYLLTSTNVTAEIAATGNTGVGVRMFGARNCVLHDSLIRDNTSDGVEITTNADYNKVTNCHIESNGAYGIDIVNSTCDNNIILGNTYLTNTSGTLNDVGTGTVISANI